MLIQSAAYTAARGGDRDGMRELTDEAASIAAQSGGRALCVITAAGSAPRRWSCTGCRRRTTRRSRRGGRGGAEDRPGEPADDRAACPVLDGHGPARAYANWGRREDCVSALLSAEREAPEETHARPAVRDLVSSLLVTGRTGPELRGLAARCGIT